MTRPIVTPRWMRPREGHTVTASTRSICPSSESPHIGGPPHHIEPGDPITYCASAWRCQDCARRIMRRDKTDSE